MAKPRMCPHCRAFVDSQDRTCQYCGNDLPLTPARRIRAEERTQQRASWQTGFTSMILMLINGGLYAAAWILTTRFTGDVSMMGGIDGQILVAMGGKFGLLVFTHGEWWRLLSANFLHANLLHLAFNTMSLYNLGPLAEEFYGGSRFLVFYIVTGVVGFLASCFWSPGVSIGASASICGLVGVMYGLSRKTYNTELRSVVGRWIIAIVLFGFFVPAIDNAAHLGGLAAGILFGYVCDPPGSDPGVEAMWRGASIGAAALAAGAFLMAYLQFPATMR